MPPNGYVKSRRRAGDRRRATSSGRWVRGEGSKTRLRSQTGAAKLRTRRPAAACGSSHAAFLPSSRS